MVLVSSVLWNLDLLLLWMRHLVVLLLLSGCVSEPRWCHSGSWAFEVRCGPILITAKFDVVCFSRFEHRAVSSSSLVAFSSLGVPGLQDARVHQDDPWLV